MKKWLIWQLSKRLRIRKKKAHHLEKNQIWQATGSLKEVRVVVALYSRVAVGTKKKKSLLNTTLLIKGKNKVFSKKR
jgi:hypothetical protein